MAGIIYGAVVELIVIRRLFTAPRVIVLVATIGIAQLSLGMRPWFDTVRAGDRSTRGMEPISGAKPMVVSVAPDFETGQTMVELALVPDFDGQVI